MRSQNLAEAMGCVLEAGCSKDMPCCSHPVITAVQGPQAPALLYGTNAKTVRGLPGHQSRQKLVFLEEKKKSSLRTQS